MNNNNITVQQKLEIIKELTEINPKCLNALLDYDWRIWIKETQYNDGLS